MSDYGFLNDIRDQPTRSALKAIMDRVGALDRAGSTNDTAIRQLLARNGNGQQYRNLADANHDLDAVNLRTLKRYVESVITGIPRITDEPLPSVPPASNPGNPPGSPPGTQPPGAPPGTIPPPDPNVVPAFFINLLNLYGATTSYDPAILAAMENDLNTAYDRTLQRTSPSACSIRGRIFWMGYPWKRDQCGFLVPSTDFSRYADVYRSPDGGWGWASVGGA